jgi:hypothetical protein
LSLSRSDLQCDYRIIEKLGGVGSGLGLLLSSFLSSRVVQADLPRRYSSEGVFGFMHAAALMLGGKFQEDAWAQLLHGVKTGEVSFLKAYGVPPIRLPKGAPRKPQVLWWGE